MVQAFYSSQEYKEKQSQITKQIWEKKKLTFIYKRENRFCARIGCGKFFITKPSDEKVYCTRSCAGMVNNVKRGPMPEIVKLKIGKSLIGRPNPRKGIDKVPRVERKCESPGCNKIFLSKQWMNRKFCSNKCAMAVIGGKPTSPKASKGKGGIRVDIDNNIYFYSRWEANFARLLNSFNIKWEYQPKTFDLITQKYTPDFYLPDCKTYIEIKNFLWKYSEIRDRKFRELYPETRLILFLKDNYLILEKQYGKIINNWEFKNSPF